MKMKFVNLVALCMTVLLFCCTDKQQPNSLKGSSGTFFKSTTLHPVFSDSIEMFFHSKGVASLLFSEGNSKKFKILNKDATLYAIIDIVEDIINIEGDELKLSQFSNDNTLKEKYGFAPKEFYPELSVVQFEFVGIKENKIEIYIDKEKRITKYIESNEFKMEGWKKHLIGCMIDFNKDTNIVREKPDAASVSLHYEDSEDDLIFVITEIHGDWVKIECSEICGYTCDAENKFNGWIMWKRQEKMIVRLVYSC